MIKLFSSSEKYLQDLHPIEAINKRILNRDDVLEMELEKGIDIQKKDRILIFLKRFNHWREFIVETVIEQEDSIYIQAEDSVYELHGDFIENKTAINTKANIALDTILVDTRWERGRVDDLGDASNYFYRKSVKQALREVRESYGADIRTRIDVGENRILHRYIDLLSRRGKFLGERFVSGEDLEIKRTFTETPIVTALYGFGKGQEISNTSDDSSEPVTTVGYGRRLDFGIINSGKMYVENADAKARWGRLDSNGARQHIFDKVEFDDVEDQGELLQLTLEELERRSEPKIVYEGVIIDALSDLGDTVVLIDGGFTPPLRVTARVMEMTLNILDDNSTTVVLGNYIDSFVNDWNNQQALIDAFRDKEAIWDRATNLSPDGALNAQYLEGLIAELNEKMNNLGGYFYLTEGEGIITTDKPINENPTQAIQILGGAFRIANSKDAMGNWNWRAFGDGNGFTADEFKGGLLRGGKVNFDLTNGTLLIGNSIDDYNLYFDGNSLKIKVGGKTLEQALADAGGGSGAEGEITMGDITSAINQAIQDNNASLDATLGSLQGSIDGLEAIVDESFKDGIIDEMEVSSLNKQIELLAVNMKDVTAQYNSLYYNIYLLGDAKSNLQVAQNEFLYSHNQLINAITRSIQGDLLPEEVNLVALKFEAYGDYMALLKTALEEARDYIVEFRAGLAEDEGKDYTDGKFASFEFDRDSLQIQIGDVRQLVENAVLVDREIGVNNLITGTKNGLPMTSNNIGVQPIIYQEEPENGRSYLERTGANNGLGISAKTGMDVDVEQGQFYTMAVDVMTHSAGRTASLDYHNVKELEPGVWNRLFKTVKASDNYVRLAGIIAPEHLVGEKLYYRRYSLVEGTSKMLWLPSLEDIKNGAITESISYTQQELAQFIVLKDSITSQVSNLENIIEATGDEITNMNTRLQEAEVKITPEKINLAVAEQVDIKTQGVLDGAKLYTRNQIAMIDLDSTSIGLRVEELERVKNGNDNLFVRAKGFAGFYASDGRVLAPEFGEFTSDKIRIDRSKNYFYAVQGKAPNREASYTRQQMTIVSLFIASGIVGRRILFEDARPAGSTNYYEYNITGILGDFPQATSFTVSSRYIDEGMVKLEEGTKFTGWNVADEDANKTAGEFKLFKDKVELKFETGDIRIASAVYSFDKNSFTIGGGGFMVKHTPTESLWHHTDGSYSRASSQGFMKVSADGTKRYRHLFKVIKLELPANQTRWIKIGKDVGGHSFDFAFSLSVAGDQFATAQTAVIQAFVISQALDPATNYSTYIPMRFNHAGSGEWEIPVRGYKTMLNVTTRQNYQDPIQANLIIIS